MASTKHFLDLSAVSAEDLRLIMEDAKTRKTNLKAGKGDKPLAGKMLAMIFEKPSTRTRVSFDVGMRQLGGETLFLSGTEMQLGRAETIGDTAKVLSRYVDAIMIRTTDHSRLLELAEHATVPVINGLTNLSHPCQVMADVMTFEEKKGSIEGATVAWLGDANNVATSWVHAAARFGCKLRIASPKAFAPSPQLLAWAKEERAEIEVTEDPLQAARGADCVITDVWVSMGDNDEKKRMEALRPFQVDAKVMAEAAKDAIFMHCLPAHRGDEVTAEVIDGPQSAVWEEAENRLHVQKAILSWCLSESPASKRRASNKGREPRRWRGAILPDTSEVLFTVLEPEKRMVAAVADHKEVRDVRDVRIAIARQHQLTLLFDPNSSLEERIFAEQFQV